MYARKLYIIKKKYLFKHSRPNTDILLSRCTDKCPPIMFIVKLRKGFYVGRIREKRL